MAAVVYKYADGGLMTVYTIVLVNLSVNMCPIGFVTEDGVSAWNTYEEARNAIFAADKKAREMFGIDGDSFIVDYDVEDDSKIVIDTFDIGEENEAVIFADGHGEVRPICRNVIESFGGFTNIEIDELPF